MGRHIYTDQETEQTIRNILNFKPDFNLAMFFKKQLFEFAGKVATEKLDIDYLKSRIMDLESEAVDNQKQIEYFTELLSEAKERKKDQELTENNKKELDLENKEKLIFNFIDSINQTCPYVKGKKTIRKLAEEFYERKEDFDSLFDFVVYKGYKQEEEKMIDQILEVPKNENPKTNKS